MPAAAKKNVGDDEFDDDSDNDSDYCPENDPEAAGAEETGDVKEKLSTISHGRKRKVDDLWAAMQEDSVVSNTKATKVGPVTGISTKKKSSSKKNADILASIFGKKQSAKIIGGITSKSAEGSDALRIKQAARDSVKMLQKKTIVTETRKFAGQEITIERTVKGQAVGDSKPTLGTAKVSALDSVLDTMKGPKTVSTVAKSNFDWENYKEKEGLEDELSAASKEGFLTRKDFLQRCDYRAYEQERDERLIKSSSASCTK